MSATLSPAIDGRPTQTITSAHHEGTRAADAQDVAYICVRGTRQRLKNAIGVYFPVRGRLPRAPPSAVTPKHIEPPSNAHGHSLHVGDHFQQEIHRAHFGAVVFSTQHILPTMSSSGSLSNTALPARSGYVEPSTAQTETQTLHSAQSTAGSSAGAKLWGLGQTAFSLR